MSLPNPRGGPRGPGRAPGDGCRVRCGGGSRPGASLPLSRGPTPGGAFEKPPGSPNPKEPDGPIPPRPMSRPEKRPKPGGGPGPMRGPPLPPLPNMSPSIPPPKKGSPSKGGCIGSPPNMPIGGTIIGLFIGIIGGRIPIIGGGRGGGPTFLL
jgi:hypothetical protein